MYSKSMGGTLNCCSSMNPEPTAGQIVCVMPAKLRGHQKYWCLSQDHDDPNSYANHTCEVKGCHHKRGSPDSDVDIGQPAKRPKPTLEVKSTSDEPADEERKRSNHAASVSGAPADGSRYNPIDHIFQFHKVGRALNPKQ